jgi:hypothetical protein
MRVLLFFSLFLLIACGKSKTVNFSIKDVELVASGPLTEGSNTAQGDYTSKLADFLKEHDATLEQVTAAQLTKATLMLPDSMNSDLFSEITLQMTAEAAAMQKVGVLNPVPGGKTTLDITVAQEQEKISNLLTQPKLTLVADVNLKKDTTPDLIIKGNFDFQLTIKQ